MALTQSEILKRIGLPTGHPQRIVITPLSADSESNVVHVELNLSEDFVRLSPSTSQSQSESVRASNEQVLLQQHDFILASSSQVFGFPMDIFGRGVLKTSLARFGVHMSPFKIDPGFQGRVVMPLTNASSLPISLHQGMAVASLELFEIKGSASSPLAETTHPSFLAIAFDRKFGPAALVRSGSLVRLKDTESEQEMLVQPWSLDYQAQLPSRTLLEFEQMIREPSLSESDFQRFFERNDWLLCSSDYTEVRPQIVLEREGEPSLIPDFFLKPVSDELWDILEIKRPVEKLVIERKNRRRFSSAVYEGVTQLRNYALYFDEARNRERVKQRYGITTYRPKLILLIGAKMPASDPVETQKLRLGFSDVRIMTYDELIKRARHKLHSGLRWKL
jgi:deoxycytidine triphosphate deaminase